MNSIPPTSSDKSRPFRFTQSKKKIGVLSLGKPTTSAFAYPTLISHVRLLRLLWASFQGSSQVRERRNQSTARVTDVHKHDWLCYSGPVWHLVARQYVVPGIAGTGMQELQPIPGIKKGVLGWAGVIRKKGATIVMSCCNRRRTQWATSRPTLPAQHHRPVERTQLRTVSFEYTGGRRISVLGPVTGMRYHFPMPGAPVEVDQRDAAYFAAVPRWQRTQ